jgi:hypothetical protein
MRIAVLLRPAHVLSGRSRHPSSVRRLPGPVAGREPFEFRRGYQ